MFFLRDTVTNNDYHIDIIIKRFGKDHVKQCVSNGIYKISLPDDIKETLLLNKFHKKSIQTAMGNLRRGHFMENLVKQTGKVKKGTMSFNEYVTNSPYRQQFYNKLTIHLLYQKFKSAYRSRLSKIEKNIDMITCEEIKTPVIISEDWKRGNKVVYEYNTLINCAEYVKIPVGFDFEEDGREVMVYWERPTGYFVSPYTRFKFTAESIKRLYY